MTFIHQHASRREFLRRSATLGALAGSPFAANLAAIGNAAAQSSTDYKALVCVYLAGGNDNANTVVPRNLSLPRPPFMADSSLAIRMSAPSPPSRVSPAP